jgi:DNA-binding MarR family transcriptional regulator
VPFVKNDEWLVRVPVSNLNSDIHELPARAFRLMLVIESFARKSNMCWACNDTLAKVVGKSRRTVQRTLRILEERGYVRRQTDSKGRPFLFLRRRLSRMD